MRERRKETRCLMSYSRLLGAGLASATALILLSMFSMPLLSQTAVTPASAATAGALKCTAPPAKDPTKPAPLNGQKDPFVGALAGPNLPPGLLPISDTTRKSIFGLGLPCQEEVSPS